MILVVTKGGLSPTIIENETYIRGLGLDPEVVLKSATLTYDSAYILHEARLAEELYEHIINIEERDNISINAEHLIYDLSTDIVNEVRELINNQDSVRGNDIIDVGISKDVCFIRTE